MGSRGADPLSTSRRLATNRPLLSSLSRRRRSVHLHCTAMPAARLRRMPRLGQPERVDEGAGPVRLAAGVVGGVEGCCESLSFACESFVLMCSGAD